MAASNFVSPLVISLSCTKQRLCTEFSKRVPSRVSIQNEPCFKHVLCACSAGRLDGFQCCLSGEILFYFLFNNFHPKHTTEAADAQKSSVRCSLKESSHGHSFDSLSPNNRQTGCRESPQPLSRAEQKDKIQRLLVLKNESFPLCFSFLLRS